MSTRPKQPVYQKPMDAYFPSSPMSEIELYSPASPTETQISTENPEENQYTCMDDLTPRLERQTSNPQAVLLDQAPTKDLPTYESFQTALDAHETTLNERWYTVAQPQQRIDGPHTPPLPKGGEITQGERLLIANLTENMHHLDTTVQDLSDLVCDQGNTVKAIYEINSNIQNFSSTTNNIYNKLERIESNQAITLSALRELTIENYIRQRAEEDRNPSSAFEIRSPKTIDTLEKIANGLETIACPIPILPDELQNRYDNARSKKPAPMPTFTFPNRRPTLPIPISQKSSVFGRIGQNDVTDSNYAAVPPPLPPRRWQQTKPAQPPFPPIIQQQHKRQRTSHVNQHQIPCEPLVDPLAPISYNPQYTHFVYHGHNTEEHLPR